MRKSVLFLVGLLLLAGVTPAAAHSKSPTYFNNAATPGADPFVHFDRASGYYYAYSTEGADPGYHFATFIIL